MDTDCNCVKCLEPNMASSCAEAWEVQINWIKSPVYNSVRFSKCIGPHRVVARSNLGLWPYPMYSSMRIPCHLIYFSPPAGNNQE